MKAMIALPVLLLAALSFGAAVAEQPARSTRAAPTSIALSKPFGAPPGWRLIARQGPEVPDPLGGADDTAPGAIAVCISPDDGRTCRPTLDGLLVVGGKADLFAQPHFLNDARIVHPRAGRPLLLLQFASLHSGDGDQRVATTALAYDRSRDAFAPVFEQRTGHNNNQEVRYIATGPLRGAIVSAEPTSDAPFGFWIAVNTIAGDRYREVLRYRSATRYNDGNTLAVIDSEMPNLEQRLGLWHAGLKLPLPAGPCPQPHLIKQELWCASPGGARPEGSALPSAGR